MFFFFFGKKCENNIESISASYRTDNHNMISYVLLNTDEKQFLGFTRKNFIRSTCDYNSSVM